ncbi:class E sortase [Streptomyces sp. RB6PN25]|uniref:Class E sortase n=1 Tax=Streptomyces humicola TaxID=2953240 RepID=A0ABT1PZX8_9ACTN|nr:class E sortase [Streptomyces humicola]MCQ4083235.1 class E sortase [Streptomyces humicola]
MTTSYEDTGEFAAAVGRLADPLSDPLPGASPKSEPAPGPEPDPGAYASYDYGTAYAAPGYQQQYQAPAYAYAPEAQPQWEPAPEPEPVPVAVPAPRRAPRAGGVSGVSQTAQLPVVEPGAAAAAETAAEPAPMPGGRAARRKAAKRSRGRRAAGPATVASTDAPAAPRTRMEARRAARAAKDPTMVVASRITGEVFITLGALMLLFVVYQLWYTNILADEAANGATNNLKHQWAGASATSDADMPNHFAEGQTFAIIYLPKLDVEAPIAEGVDETTILDKGEVGHYSGSLETAFPWDTTGNFAVAAHRNTHGEPFRYINKLVPGDKVVVETSSMYYTYEITSTLPQTSPSNIGVIQPIPQESGFTKPGRYITLTTCTPEFTSLYRLIVWGKMVDEQPRSKGTPAALAG